MRYLNRVNILMAAVIILSCAAMAFAQMEEKAAAPAAEAAQPAAAPAAAPATAQPKEIAIYGEVQSVDAAAGSIAIQYYDYDSDSEKTATVIVDKTSKIENAGMISDIKKGDWADVTYSDKDGKNVAKVVTVEKEEAPATEPAAANASQASPEE
jgi:hypothetical protein